MEIDKKFMAMHNAIQISLTEWEGKGLDKNALEAYFKDVFS